jgi:single-stranded-DNA-specific exonuclease
LLIIIDCGISNFEELELARKMGFEAIIIDHHEILEKLPKASIIVDPKQKGDKYPFKFFAAAGLAIELSKEILGKNMTDSLEKGFLEITALATIADMMPQTDDNLVFIEKGIRAVPNSWRPGIKAFFEMKEIYDNGFEKETISKMISLLNVKHIQNGIPAPYMVLTASSVSDAKKIIELLIKKRVQRREELSFMEEQIDKDIAKTPENKIIFKEYSADLDMLGSLASIVCNRHKKPTLIFRKRDGVCQGVTRMPEGLDGVDAMRQCKELFITYGGHPGAGGFALREENLKKFEECVTKYFEKNKV